MFALIRVISALFLKDPWPKFQASCEEASFGLACWDVMVVFASSFLLALLERL